MHWLACPTARILRQCGFQETEGVHLIGHWQTIASTQHIENDNDRGSKICDIRIRERTQYTISALSGIPSTLTVHLLCNKKWLSSDSRNCGPETYVIHMAKFSFQTKCLLFLEMYYLLNSLYRLQTPLSTTHFWMAASQ